MSQETIDGKEDVRALGDEGNGFKELSEVVVPRKIKALGESEDLEVVGQDPHVHSGVRLLSSLLHIEEYEEDHIANDDNSYSSKTPGVLLVVDAFKALAGS